MSNGALVAGGALLLVGVTLVAFAVLRPGSASAGSSVQPEDFILAGQSGQPTTSPTPSATKKPKVKKAHGSATSKAERTTSTPTAAKSKPKKTAAPDRPVAGHDYRLANVVTGKCLGALTGEVAQADCGSSGPVRLEAVRVVAGVQLWRLRDSGTANICLDAPGSGASTIVSGTVLSALTCVDPSATDNQEFQLKDVGKASHGKAEFALVNQVSGLCVDVSGSGADHSDGSSGQALLLSPCTDAATSFDDRLWIFQ